MAEKKKTGKEVTETEEQMPTHIGSKDGDTGMEAADAKDFSDPRLKILQPSSEEVVEQGLRPGEFCNSILKESVGEVVHIIPIKFQKYYIQFNEDKKIERISMDGKTWKDGTPVTADQIEFNGDTPPIAQETFSFPVYCVETQSFFVMSFAKTSIKGGRTIINICRMNDQKSRAKTGKKFPMYGNIFTISTTLIKGDKGNYFIPKVGFGGYVKDEKLYKSIDDAYKTIYKEREVVVGEAEEPETSAADSNAGSGKGEF